MSVIHPPIVNNTPSTNNNNNTPAANPLGPGATAEEYDPYAHRDYSHATSNWETVGHLITGSLGTGMLAIPITFRRVGCSVGIIGFIVISFLASYCMHQLLRIRHLVCKKHRVPQMEYADVIKAVTKKGPPCFRWLSTSSPHIVDFFTAAYHLGICCAAINFISLGAKQVTDFHWQVNLDVRIWMLISGLLIFPLNMIKTLKNLSSLSYIGDLLIMGGVSVVFYFIFLDGVPSTEGKWAIPLDDKANDLFEGVSLFYGTVMYSVQTIGVIVALENEMKNPADYRKPLGVFNLSLIVIVVSDILIGFWGYAKWGNHTLGVVSGNLPESSILTESIQIMFAFQNLFSYPLQSYVPYEIVWNNYLKSNKKVIEYEKLCSTLLRMLIPWLTVLLAIAVPFLDLLISFTGAFCLPTVGIVFPAIMEICYCYAEKKMTPLLLAKNVGLILFGIISCVLCTYQCAVSIWKQQEAYSRR